MLGGDGCSCWGRVLPSIGVLGRSFSRGAMSNHAGLEDQAPLALEGALLGLAQELTQLADTPILWIKDHVSRNTISADLSEQEVRRPPFMDSSLRRRRVFDVLLGVLGTWDSVRDLGIPRRTSDG